MTKRVIISGGPGSGKSSVIAALKQCGYPCCDEVARAVILQQQQCGGDAVPWKNVALFAARCFEHMCVQIRARASHIIFYDRGIPDLIAYLQYYKCAYMPEEYVRKASCYHPIVFLCPPWESIYTNDQQRPQTYSESVALFYQLHTVYRLLKYKIVILPRDSVKIRIKIITQMLRIKE